MKKIILVAGMFYTVTSSAVVVRAIVTAFSPVIVPGLYYTWQAHLKQEEVTTEPKDDSTPGQLEHAKALEKARAMWTEYQTGVYKGLRLPFNLAKTADAETQIPDIKSLPAHEQVGLFGGLSVYGTALGLLSLLKRK